MASTRLEKIGTIYSRLTGLLKSGAVKPDDIPIWYEVYAAFPPKLEPRYDRPAVMKPIRPILYKEDRVRAKYHKLKKQLPSINLADTNNKSQTQMVIDTYNHFINQGALDDERVFEEAVQTVQAKERVEPEFQSSDLVASFSAASHASPAAPQNTNLNVKDLFKE